MIPKIAKKRGILFYIFLWWRRVSDAFFEALKMSNSAKNYFRKRSAQNVADFSDCRETRLPWFWREQNTFTVFYLK